MFRTYIRQSSISIHPENLWSSDVFRAYRNGTSEQQVKEKHEDKCLFNAGKYSKSSKLTNEKN